MPNEARGLCGRSCEISSQLVKQYDKDTSFSKGSKLHIAFFSEKKREIGTPYPKIATNVKSFYLAEIFAFLL